MASRDFIGFIIACGVFATGSKGATLVENPVDAVTNPDGAASFRVVATGAGRLAYQWFKDGQLLVGATEQALVLSHPSTASAGRYQVRVTDAAGSVTSPNASLTVLP